MMMKFTKSEPKIIVELENGNIKDFKVTSNEIFFSTNIFINGKACKFSAELKLNNETLTNNLNVTLHVPSQNLQMREGNTKTETDKEEFNGFEKEYRELWIKQRDMAKSVKTYYSFLERTALILQIFLGCGRALEEKQSYAESEFRHYRTELKNAVANSGFCIKDAIFKPKIKAGDNMDDGDIPNFLSDKQNEPNELKELKEAIGRLNKEIGELERRKLWQTAIEGLSPVIIEINRTENKDDANAGNIKKWCGEIKSALENAGIYPKFYDDADIDALHRNRFYSENPGTINYPGLYVKSDENNWKLLNGFIGRYS